MPRTHLQLLGITCLFIAGKLEEIYPAKVQDLCFLTDGACVEQDIMDMELIILKVLNWKLSPTTLLDWIALFLQQAYYPDTSTSRALQDDCSSNQSSRNSTPEKPEQDGDIDGFCEAGPGQQKKSAFDIIHQYFPDEILVQMMQLSDLTALDLNTVDYRPQDIAAAILYHFSASNIVQKSTGFKVSSIKPAIQHVTRFALAIKGRGFDRQKRFDKVHETDWLNIQTHHDQLATVETIEDIFA